MDQSLFDDEYFDWHDLSSLFITPTSTVEEYAQYPTRGISRIPDRSRYVFVKQKPAPLRIGWRDEIKNDQSGVESKPKDDVQEKQILPGNRLIYCPKTWQISEIKFYHDLPKNAIQIAWPTDSCAIVPVLYSFTLFPKLPIELRYMIWDCALRCDPRDVKLYVDRRYRRPTRSDPNHLVRLSCHIRQHGPIASKLPIALLYACQESHLLFLRNYSNMNMSVPVQRYDLKLRIVRPRSKKTADCEIRVDRKGYINFRQDTLMIEYFHEVTGMLWSWNHTTLDLSLIQSIAVQHTFSSLRAERYYGGKSNIWELLETRCPCLKRLSLIVYQESMENFYWGPNKQPVAHILPINAEFFDGVAYGCQLLRQDEYARTSGRYALATLKLNHRTMVMDLALELRKEIRDVQRTKSLYYREVERNPNFWKKVDVNLAYVTWVISIFDIGEQVEKVIVAPPKNLQTSMPDSYFWAQRPIEVAYNRPEMRFSFFRVFCHPDGSLLNRYEGVKEMFEEQRD
ncbi:uncharacterized protein EAE97_003908 [Botrytis byssoidea]|uniref:2EXR domain-containing protein n=1 Tax=Botrytis byssoidea TaxID=139641 RepID=A0A9P5M815_9HELO|nr:uncharacterized protein EAE97_003908 [Botrytis byssoidea]KAF7948497.1 hypothetical protein EAE97_003908 [Botrytis byssoidea]